ncbi:MAG: PQQ-binding-like beta-propeller repeat protein [Actinomycetota bacterium]
MRGPARPLGAAVLAGLVLCALLPAPASAATRRPARPAVPVASVSAALCQVEGGEDGRVQAAVVLWDILYFGGKFTEVRPAGGKPSAERRHLAACRLSTGELLPWNPGADNWVLAMATDGSRIYAGGAFETVGGVRAKGLAALDPTTGTADPTWQGSAAGGWVRALTVGGERLYVGGGFGTVNGRPRAGIAALDRATGALEGWDPGRGWTGYDVRAIVVAGSKVVVSEYATDDHLLALDASSGEEVAWKTSPDYAVIALATDGSRVYMAGAGVGGSRNSLIAMDASDGDQQWEITGDGNVQAVAVAGDVVYAGGHFATVEGEARDRLLAVSAAGGDLLDWDPGVDQTGLGVYALVPTPAGLVATGEFQFVASRRQQGVAFFPSFGITGVSPGFFHQGTAGQVVVSGGMLDSVASVDLGPGVEATSFRPLSPTALAVDVVVSQDAVPGPRTVTVTDAARGSVSCAGCLVVHPAAGRTQSGEVAPVEDGPGGYRLVAADGGIFTYGDSGHFGAAGGTPLAAPIVGAARTPSGRGYWMVAADGGIFSYGEAGFHGSTGSIRLARPIVGMSATPSGRGYWLVASDGGIFAFGDAAFFGSTGSIRLAQPIVGMSATPSGAGYWLVASDGGMFSYGDAVFHGSTGAIRLAPPIVGMTATDGGRGYWLVASDGGLFSFGDAPFKGSTGGLRLAQPIIAIIR